MTAAESLTSSRDLVALVADASPAGNGQLRAVLHRLGITRVIEATDGADVIDLLAARRPDFLVIDWDLPVVSTPEVLQHLRDAARSHAPDMPVMVTIAAPTRREVETALALNVQGILAKPYSPKTLRLRLAPILPVACS